MNVLVACEEKTRDFKCENGFTYKMPENHCVFCDHCTDIFYDYTNGPYLCLCDLGHDDFETCGKFEKEKEMSYKENKDLYICYYKDFRKELDNMCVPLIINDLKRIEPIMADGELVGMVGGFTDYIDCVYVKPEYRRKGLARNAVLKFVEGNINYGIRLRIIKSNKIAYDFWSSIFELKEVGSNPVDALYEIVKIKEKDNDQRKSD